MKTTRFLFLITIGAVLLQGTNLASQSNSVPQQIPSQNRERSISDQPRDSNRDSQVGDEKPAGTGDTDREQNAPERATRRILQRGPKQGHAKRAPSHPLHSAKTPAPSNLRTETLESGMAFHQLGSTTSSCVPNKTVRYRSFSVPSASVAINGQQFKNFRDPGARLARSGGPLTAARGTAAINGTNMKRKP
jgi:hypothetical protein